MLKCPIILAKLLSKINAFTELLSVTVDQLEHLVCKQKGGERQGGREGGERGSE